MTVSSLTSRNDYVGTGSVSVYPYTFRILAEGDLVVTERDTSNVETTLVLNTDYTVSGVGIGAGGNVTLLGGNLTSGYALTIRRVPAVTQTTDIRNQGVFYPEAHEDALDRGAMIAQAQQDDIDRGLKLPETEVPTSAATAIPAVSDRASKVLGFDVSGNPLAVAAMPTSSVTVTAWSESLLDDSTAAEGRTTLGIDGASGNIAEGDLAAGAVTEAKIGAGAVVAAKIGTGAVETAKVADDAITLLKLSSKDGWWASPYTWTYSAADTIAIVGVDVSSEFGDGDKIKLTQVGSVKFFYVTGVGWTGTQTEIGVTGGSSYTLTNNAISSPYISRDNNPVGFPQSFSFGIAGSGWSGGSGEAFFTVIGLLVHYKFYFTGTSNSTAANLTYPFTAFGTTGTLKYSGVLDSVTDNGALDAYPGTCATKTVANYLACYRGNRGANAWTASGTKTVNGCITYYL